MGSGVSGCDRPTERDDFAFGIDRVGLLNGGTSVPSVQSWTWLVTPCPKTLISIRKRCHRDLVISRTKLAICTVACRRQIQRRIQRIGNTTTRAIVIGWHKPSRYHLTISDSIQIAPDRLSIGIVNCHPILNRKWLINIRLTIITRSIGVILNSKLNRRANLKTTRRNRRGLSWRVILILINCVFLKKKGK